MNFILNLLMVIISVGFALMFLFSAILNSIRGYKMKKEMAASHRSEVGTIKIRKVDKKRIVLQVEYASSNNGITFNEYFEVPLAGNENKYLVGDKVTINYPDTSKLSKVYQFPISIDDEKLTTDKTSTFMDYAIFAAGVYICIMIFINVLTKDETGTIGLQWVGRPLVDATAMWGAAVDATGCFNFVYLLIYAFFYVVFFAYVKERITGLNESHKNQYLKLCGVKGKAEVKTYKYSRSKDDHGRKEAQMKVEFFTNKGDKIECDMSSYLYSETEEQYINILYDPFNPKNVVYLRENDRK